MEQAAVAGYLGIDLNDNPDNFNDNKENESLNDTQLTGAESFIGTVAKKERKNIIHLIQ